MIFVFFELPSQSKMNYGKRKIAMKNAMKNVTSITWIFYATYLQCWKSSDEEKKRSLLDNLFHPFFPYKVILPEGWSTKFVELRRIVSYKFSIENLAIKAHYIHTRLSAVQSTDNVMGVGWIFS